MRERPSYFRLFLIKRKRLNYQVALEKLEALRDCLEKAQSGVETQEDRSNLCMRYGEVEEIINRFGGVNRIEVPERGGKSVYPNYIEAGYLSGRTIHQYQGYNQLLKIIGKVRQMANDPNVPQVESSITNLIQTIRRFRECCQYIQNPPTNENEVQDILWIMLRSQFERIEREDTLSRFGTKTYKPDFGIPDLRVLIEVKFIGGKTDRSRIQEEILADIPGYLGNNSTYDGIIVFVYDQAQKLLDPRKFIEDIRSVDGIIDIIVVPGIS